MAYLTVSEFKTLTFMPDEQVVELEARFPSGPSGGSGSYVPSWLESQLAQGSGEIDARLAKRYAVPFAAPYPVVVQGWLADWVTPRAYYKLGVNPSDSTFEAAVAAATRVEEKLKEAADAVTGLFELPLRADLTASGVIAPRPMAYSELSPYSAKRLQRDAVRGGRL